MQEEDTNVNAVGFSDYAHHFETLRKLKKFPIPAVFTTEMPRTRVTQCSPCESSTSKATNYQILSNVVQNDETPEDEMKPTSSESSKTLQFSFARGHVITTMADHINARNMKRSRADSSFRTQQKTCTLPSLTCVNHIQNERHKPIHKDIQDTGVDARQDSATKVFIDNLKVESTNHSGNKTLLECDYIFTANSHVENKFQVNTVQPKQDAEYGVLNAEVLKDVPFSLCEDMPLACVPAGMVIQKKPVIPKTRTSVEKNEIHSKSTSQLSPILYRQPPIKSVVTVCLPKQNIASKTMPKHQGGDITLDESPTTNKQVRAVNFQTQLTALNCALERSKVQKVVTSEDTVCADELHTDINRQQNDDDMTELFKLACGTVDTPLEEDAQKMLRLSKLADLIEEGRVLVRSVVPHTPTHNLKDFPFDDIIHEALKTFEWEKPKIIQAYVWEAILRGHHVAFVAGPRAGKTVGYLVPIINNLLDKSEYSEVPSGCSPLVVVICSSWENAEIVNRYCCRLTNKVTDFRSAVFTDGSARNLQLSLPFLINGITLLSTTAPALNYLLEESKGVIGFDRCCHLVLDDADVLLQEHSESIKKIFQFYQESVKRMSPNYFIPRQIVACANHWTKGMETISSKAMRNPSIFISSCMEAAIYGEMKVDVRMGTRQEMDSQLLQIVIAKQTSRIIIFCRGSTEVGKVQKMLLTIGIKPLLAHNQSVVSDLDFVSKRWSYSQPGSAILICTDDVLERLDIKNAHTLIHYFIPHHSKYNFSYRLSFALDNFLRESCAVIKPETYLLITKEFNNSLLTIVRFMQRFGHSVSDELATEAILSFCGKEVRKKNLPFCETFKAFGFCRNMKLCGLRHVVLDCLDKPTVPQNGLVRLRITAVQTATRYYARILKHRNEMGQLIDLSGSHFEIVAELRKYFREVTHLNPVVGSKVEVGNLYARKCTEDLFERVRVESLVERDHQGKPVEVSVVSIDQGCVLRSFVHELFDLPDALKNKPPAAVEIFLVGAKPMDRSTTWSRYSVDFVRERLLSKELDGRVVLALSSTLWLQPLHERKRLDGFKSSVVVGDIRKELLLAQLAENNEEHMIKLYHLCETGGICLPNYNVGLNNRLNKNSAAVTHAFLTLNEETEVSVVATDSPHRFYINILKFQKILNSLEEDIKQNHHRFKILTYEGAQIGTLCLAESSWGSCTWRRCSIVKKLVVNDRWSFRIFFVDYGRYGSAFLNDLKTLPQRFVSRLPFQAIACSLVGVGPKISDRFWSEKENVFFMANTTAEHKILVEANRKQENVDEVTRGPHYCVSLKIRGETGNIDLAQRMISLNYASPLKDEEEIQNSLCSSAILEKKPEEKCKGASLKEENINVYEDENIFDISADWLDYVINCSTTQSKKVPQPVAPASKNEHSSKISIIKKNERSSSISKSLSLIDHTLPFKSSLSRFPTTKWSQNKQYCFVTFVLEPINGYNLELTENYLCFSAEVNGEKYELNTSTYGYIVPQKSYHTRLSYGIKATLHKQEPGAMWTRFIQSPVSQYWLSRDFNNWERCIDESDDDKEFQEPIVDPKYAFEDEQPNSSSSDSDEECTDAFWMRDDE